MKTTRLSILLVAGCLGSTRFAAHGQTGRIARASHGGRLTVGGDNFGIPPGLERRGELVRDSLVRLDDTWALSYNRSHSVPHDATDTELRKAPWQSWTERVQYRYYWQTSQTQTMQELQDYYPGIKLVGFGKLAKVGRKKPAGRSQAFPKRPFQYSYWQQLTGVAALGTVGWLLAAKPKPSYTL